MNFNKLKYLLLRFELFLQPSSGKYDGKNCSKFRSERDNYLLHRKLSPLNFEQFLPSYFPEDGCRNSSKRRIYLVAAAPKCNDSDLRWCMEELKVLTSNQDLAFAQTDEELSKTCGHLQDAMQCVNNFTGRCFDKAQRDLYRTLTSGAQKLLQDLCTHDSDFRKQYLQHAGCYQNLSADYRKCADNYLVQQESAKKLDMHVQDRLRKSCCLFDGYKECTRRAVLLKCSKEAADLGEQIVTKAGGPLVQTHCKNYKHDSKDCLFSNFLAASSRSSIVPPASYVFNGFISLILSAASHFYVTHR